MWPPSSFGLVDRCALFDVRNQDRRKLSGLAHCALRHRQTSASAGSSLPVLKKDRSCAHSFRTRYHLIGKGRKGSRLCENVG